MTQENIRKISGSISFPLIIAFLNLIAGCSYYRVNTVHPDADRGKTIGSIQQAKRYIIIHQGTEAWHLKEISLNEEKKELSGVKEILSTKRMAYKHTQNDIANRMRASELNPSYEAHIYISEYLEEGKEKITIPFQSIKKIEIYDYATGETIASHVLGTAGVLLGLTVLVGIIALLTKSSCPFVYISNGNSFHFTGEMYGGAIYSTLERDDYMPLPGLELLDSNFTLKISNELLERQYTNLAELVEIEHPSYSEVLIDKNGEIQTICSPQKPLKAITNNGLDISLVVAKTDSNHFSFDNDQRNDKSLSGIIFSFKKPIDADTGKLILKAKNSLWLDYIYGKFNEQFGTYYNTFAEKQKKVPAEKNIQWALDQGIPLSVYLETEKGWEFIDYFNVIGPLASRDVVMSIDLGKIKGEEVKIKLECGFMFWEIDYVAMDFSKNIPVKIKKLSPSSAIDETGKEVSALLEKTDNHYLIQPEPGNEVILKYLSNQAKENYRKTCFLHSRGYYEYIRNYTNKPDFISLNSFKKKGAFTRFSKQHYFRFINNKDFLTSALNNGN